MRPYIVFPWAFGLVVLLTGLIACRRDLRRTGGLDRLILLGPVFMGAPLAAFSAEHFVLASFIQNQIPAWMPGRLVLAYVVGVGLLAAAVSFALRRFMWLSASLLALMFVTFVTTMHVPNAMKGSDQYAWTVALRDLSFGGGAMALAGAAGVGRRADGSSWFGTVGRIIVGVACVVFGVLHGLQPTHAPGVPLQKMTAAWMPLPALWGYLTGAAEVVAGGFILANRRTRDAAAWLGFVLVVVIVVIYLPFVPVAVEGGEKLEALNYFWDTLLFAGAVLAVGLTRDPV
jgi:uncharacterized membrane protein YphA (DoxX/SURF4 family)